MAIDDSALERCLVDSELRRRRQRTARHEAGHAVVAWLISGRRNPPPFERITILVREAEGADVVPGEVAVDSRWLCELPIRQRAAVILAGAYFQDGSRQYDELGWRDYLQGLDGSDSADDIAHTQNMAEDPNYDVAVLREAARQEIHLLGTCAEDWVRTISTYLLEVNSIEAREFMQIVSGEPIAAPNAEHTSTEAAPLPPVVTLLLRDRAGGLRVAPLGLHICADLEVLIEIGQAAEIQTINSYFELLEDIRTYDPNRLSEAATRVCMWYDPRDGQASVDSLVRVIDSGSVPRYTSSLSEETCNELQDLYAELQRAAEAEEWFCFASA